MAILSTISTVSATKLTATNASSLSTRSLQLIGTIRKAEDTYARLFAEAKELGIEITPTEGDTELSLLQKLSVAATSKAHDLAKTEDLARIERVAEGKAATARPGLAGFLNRLADRVA